MTMDCFNLLSERIGPGERLFHTIPACNKRFIVWFQVGVWDACVGGKRTRVKRLPARRLWDVCPGGTLPKTAFGFAKRASQNTGLGKEGNTWEFRNSILGVLETTFRVWSPKHTYAIVKKTVPVHGLRSSSP
jgi:hypothetical protein